MANRFELRPLEKALPHVCSRAGNIGRCRSFPAWNRQREQRFSAESSRLIVRSRSPAQRSRRRRVYLAVVIARHAPAAEPRSSAPSMIVSAGSCVSASRDQVIVDDVFRRLLDRRRRSGANRHAFGDVPFALFQQIARDLEHVRARTLFWRRPSR